MPASRSRSKIIADYPPIADHRGPRFWLQPRNLWLSRKGAFRKDHSSEWRAALHGQNPVPPAHSRPVAHLIAETDRVKSGYRCIVLADTGEGDKSQYGLLPLIRALEPDFMIINGDVAYPAGDHDDFLAGFFQPYMNLNIPIWATPGNHEYYSAQRGTEFYQTFCTYTYSREWSRHGLKLVPQPGMYWEISDERANLVILGVDSGMKGNLDGVGGVPPDDDQHEWLTARLGQAQRRQQNAIILFHVPGLVNGEHASETHLDRLHRTIASFDCVRLVLTGHEHSFQMYDPAVFEKYVRRGSSPRAPVRESAPHYMVIGGGGAYMGSTAWFKARKKPTFKCAKVCPDDWEAYITRARRKRAEWPIPMAPGIRQRLGRWRKGMKEWGVDVSYSALRRFRSPFSAIDRTAEAAAQALSEDADIPDMMSFVLIEVENRDSHPQTTVTPIFQEDFSALFNVPPGTRINVQAGVPAPDPAMVDACRQRGASISW